MRFKILTLILLFPLTIQGQSFSTDSVEVSIYNSGKHYIKKYSISVDNKAFLFKDISTGEYSRPIKLPFIWPYNKTEVTVIVKQRFRNDIIITQSSQPLDHVGDTKYVTGKINIIVTTKFKHRELLLNEVVKKE
jgi:hypothetical protein